MADTETNKDVEPETKNPPSARRAKGRPSLEGLSLEELTAVRDEAETRRQTLMRENRNRIAKEFEDRLRTMGMKPEDIYPALTRRPGPANKNQPAAPRRKVAPKYRGPEGETWTGQGFTPTWLRELEEQGRRREEFLINPEPSDAQAAG